MSEPTYRPATGADRDELARFLTEHQWSFHARARLSPTEAAGVVAGWDLDGESARAWWLERDGQVVGLLRVDDLGSSWDPGSGASRPRPGATTGPCGPSCAAAAT
jgi:hypothetical protein